MFIHLKMHVWVIQQIDSWKTSSYIRFYFASARQQLQSIHRSVSQPGLQKKLINFFFIKNTFEYNGDSLSNPKTAADNATIKFKNSKL